MFRGRRPSSGLALTIAVGACAALGFAVVTVYARRTPDSETFSGASRALVWRALIVAQVAAWPVLWRVGTDRLRDLRAYDVPPRHRDEALRLGVIFQVLLALWLPPQLAGPPPFPVLWGHGARVGVVLFGTFAAVAPCLLAIWRAHDALAPEVEDEASARLMFDRLNPLRSVFTSAIGAVGVSVTLATLATGALRGTVLQVKPKADFPPEYVLLYGSFFTVLLAAAAAPAYGRLRRRAAAVVDRLLPVVPPPEEGWRERLAQRKDLGAYLNADATLLQTMQGGVLVAGPLLTGLVAALVTPK